MKDTELQTLTKAIEKLLAKEVAPVLPIAPVAPVAPVLPIVSVNPGDHDLLTRLIESVTQNFSQVKEAIKELSEGTTNKLSDHEIRLRRLEIWGFTAIGILLALQFYFNYLRKG